MRRSPQTVNSQVDAESISPLAGVSVILVIAVLGLFYVKWLPYYQRAWSAFASQSIGPSVLTGGGPAAALLLTLPPVSLPSLVMVRRVFSFRVIVLITLAAATIGIVAGVTAELLPLK
jgi:uncharacterized membrane protein YraQ (UPF0718 family)